MLYIDLNDHAIEILQTKRTVIGGEVIISSSRKEIAEGLIINGLIVDPEKVKVVIEEILQSSYPKPIKDESAVLTISDKQVITHRFHFEGQLRDEELSEKIIVEAKNIIPYDPVELVNFYRTVNKTAAEIDIVYTASAKNTIAHYARLVKSLSLSLDYLFPRSFAVYEWLKQLCGKGEVIIYASLDKNFADYLIYDQFGLIEAIYKKIGSKGFTEETKKIIEEVEKEKSIEISKLITGGFDSMELHTSEISQALNIPVLKLNEIIDSILKNNNIDFDSGGVSKMLFIHTISSLILKHSESPPNFAADIDKISDIVADASVDPKIKSSDSSELEISTGDAKFDTDSADKSDITRKKGTINSINNKLLMIVLAIITGIAVFFGIYFITGSAGSFNLPIISRPSSTPAPTIIPTLTPTPTVDISLKREDLKVKVENGTSKSGYAKEIADYLEKAGYKKISKGNADKDTYEKSVIKIKKSKNNYLSVLLLDIKNKFDTSLVENLPDSDSSDVVIVLGLK